LQHLRACARNGKEKKAGTSQAGAVQDVERTEVNQSLVQSPGASSGLAGTQLRQCHLGGAMMRVAYACI